MTSRPAKLFYWSDPETSKQRQKNSIIIIQKNSFLLLNFQELMIFFIHMIRIFQGYDPNPHLTLSLIS